MRASACPGSAALRTLMMGDAMPALSCRRGRRSTSACTTVLWAQCSLGAAAIEAALSMAAPASGETAGPNGVFAPLPEPLEVDQAKAELGRMLFFDERLSGDTGRSCASCHDPAQRWGDGQALSEGTPAFPTSATARRSSTLRTTRT